MNKNIFIGVLLVIILVSAFIFIGVKRSQLNSYGRYTIGITNGQDGKFIKYKFYYQGKEFENDSPKQKYNPEIRDGRYYVKFLTNDLSISEIFWEKPVPNHIKEAPPEGWKEIPE